MPDAGLIQVVDLAKGQAIGALPTQGHHANFPMALDSAAHRILIAFRSPARLLVLSNTDGSVVADLDTCGDADDLFVDAKRHRVYVICGAGVVDVFEDNAGAYQRIGQVGTCARRSNRPVCPRARQALCCGPGGRPGAGRHLGVQAGAMKLSNRARKMMD